MKRNTNGGDYSEVINYYDSIARGYDELHFEEQKEKFRVLKEALRLRKHSGIQNPPKMLDVGCGTFFSHDYFREYVDIQGVEPSAKMVELFRESHPDEKERIQVGLAEEVVERYGEDEFDFVICVSVAHHFKDPVLAFRAMAAACRDSGALGITLLKGVKNFRHLEDVLGAVFLVQARVDAGRDVVFVCRRKQKGQFS